MYTDQNGKISREYQCRNLGHNYGLILSDAMNIVTEMEILTPVLCFNRRNNAMIRLLLALTALGLSACATTQSSNMLDGYDFNLEDDPRLGEKMNSACSVRTVRGFSLHSDTTIVFDISPRRKILVEVFGMCHNLETAMRIALDPKTSCLTPGDKIIVSSSMFAGSSSPFDTETCRVKSIYSWGYDPDKYRGSSRSSNEEKT